MPPSDPGAFPPAWNKQERIRRAKFSWTERRVEDGKIIFTKGYYIGGVILFAALVIGPWAVGVHTIWEHFFG